MGIREWVAYGYSKGKFHDWTTPVYGTIEFYDIGLDTDVGVRYPDNSRQAQPMGWYGRDLQKRMAQFRAEKKERPVLARDRPRLATNGAGGSGARPRIPVDPEPIAPSRPRLGAAVPVPKQSRPRLKL